jgi:peptide/nickel transport system permease protein
VLTTLGRWRGEPDHGVGFGIVFALSSSRVRAATSPVRAYELNPVCRAAAPSRSHFFGTGNFGEDIFSRVLFGAR